MKYILVFLLILTCFNCAIKCNQQTDSTCEKCTFFNAFKSLKTIQKIAEVKEIRKRLWSLKKYRKSWYGNSKIKVAGREIFEHEF